MAPALLSPVTDNFSLSDGFRWSQKRRPTSWGWSWWDRPDVPTLPGMFSGSPERGSTSSAESLSSPERASTSPDMFLGSRERRLTSPEALSWPWGKRPTWLCVHSGSPTGRSTTSKIFSGRPAQPSTKANWLVILNLRLENGGTRFRFFNPSSSRKKLTHHG
jgi:hypothetical protein